MFIRTFGSMDHLSRLPGEILTEIFAYCDSSDLRNLQKTSRKLGNIAESSLLWKRLWHRLVRKLPLDVALKLLEEPIEANYKEMYRRLKFVISSLHAHIPGELFYKNIVVDIGSKTSWVITDTLTRRHPTVVSLSTNSSASMTTTMSSGRPQPFCRHCQQTRTSQFNPALSGKLKTFHLNDASHCYGDAIKNVNPLDALRNGDFTIYSYFLKHILLKECPEIRRKPTSVVLCDSGELNLDKKRIITCILFEEIKAARICFMNKAVAASAAIALDTCLVVDSGANNTVVTPVVDGSARLESSNRKPIGGRCIAYYLAKSMEWKGLGQNVAIASLDDSRLKAHCALSLCAKHVPTTKNVTVQLPPCLNISGSHVARTVVLGTELHLAPEMMYVTLDLPTMIRQSLTEFNEPVKKTLLSHIILIGGNSALDGLKMRLTKDLKLNMGKYSNIINVHRPVAFSIFDPFILLDEKSSCWPQWITREEYIVRGTLVIC